MDIPPGSRTIACDLGGVVADADTIDALARLQLAAQRLGLDLRLRHASGELRELVAFAGLEDVLRLEPCGKAEEREQPLRVEEERQLGDPAVGELDHL
jgi:hypothetical protein